MMILRTVVGLSLGFLAMFVAAQTKGEEPRTPAEFGQEFCTTLGHDAMAAMRHSVAWRYIARLEVSVEHGGEEQLVQQAKSSGKSIETIVDEKMVEVEEFIAELLEGESAIPCEVSNGRRMQCPALYRFLAEEGLMDDAIPTNEATLEKVAAVYGVRHCGMIDIHSDEGVMTAALVMFEDEWRIVGGVLREVDE